MTIYPVSAYGTQKFIVSTVAGQGTHTTLASALTSASSGDTIFLRTSVTENVTLKAGVKITASTDAGQTNTVSITGKITYTDNGSASISGIRLVTNSDNFLVCSGSNQCNLYLSNCFLGVTGGSTGISFTNSNAASSINIFDSTGNLVNNTSVYFAHSSAGALAFLGCSFGNTGASTVASTQSAGTLFVYNCQNFASQLTTSGTTAIFFVINSNIGDGANLCITHGSTSGTSSKIANSRIETGSAVAVTISASATVNMSLVSVVSTNVAPIAGAGTLINGGISFASTGQTITTTTQTARNFAVGGITFDGGTNNLQNYTTGTFTPVIQGGSSTGTGTYSTQVGRYTRIGNRVFIYVAIVWSAHTGTGQIRIANLPFTVNANDNSGMAIGAVVTLAVGAALMPMISATPSTTYCSLASYNSTTGAFATVNIGTAATLAFSGSYEV